MKAVVFKGVGSRPLETEEVGTPAAGEGQLLLNIKYCGVCGTDLHFTEADTPVKPGAVMGHEFCGEVVEIGPGVKGSWKIGDRAVAMPFIGCGDCAVCHEGMPALCRQSISHASGAISGGFAEYSPVGAVSSVKLPDSISWESAALVEPLAVGVHAVRKAQMTPGANVLVMGAGPVGLSVLLWAKAMGARNVIVASRSNRGEAMAAAFGADGFIYGDQDIRSEFRRLTGSAPQLIFEAVGALGQLSKAITLSDLRGRIVIVGGGGKPDPITPGRAMAKELTIVGSLGYDIFDYRLVVDKLAKEQIYPEAMITDKVSFEDFPAAVEALRERTYQCKVLLSTTATRSTTAIPQQA
jgi:threonine dehydrogenase-like Zn-dependent dehydrogenase